MVLYIQLIIKIMKINWFINLNQSLILILNNLFKGKEINNYENKILFLQMIFYIIDSKNGSILFKKILFIH